MTLKKNALLLGCRCISFLAEKHVLHITNTWIIYLIFGVNFSSLLHQKSNNIQIIILTGCMKCCPAILLDMYRYMNTECMCRERVVIGGKLYVRYIFVYVCAYMYLIHHTIHFSLAIWSKIFASTWPCRICQ